MKPEAGDLLGIRSFFERGHLSRSTIRSVGPSTVAWIDQVPCRLGKRPKNVLMPLILQTLERRQAMVYHLKEREQDRQHLQEMERLSTLGQFSAWCRP